MKRLGIFTGHVYTEDEAPLIKECCKVLNDREVESVALQNQLYLREHTNCKGCFGCPESIRHLT